MAVYDSKYSGWVTTQLRYSSLQDTQDRGWNINASVPALKLISVRARVHECVPDLFLCRMYLRATHTRSCEGFLKASRRKITSVCVQQPAVSFLLGNNKHQNGNRALLNSSPFASSDEFSMSESDRRKNCVRISNPSKGQKKKFVLQKHIKITGLKSTEKLHRFFKRLYYLF